MKIAYDKQDKYNLLRIENEKLDAKLAPQLKTEFITLHAEGVKNIIVDLSHVKYIDSSGLSAILTANRLCENVNGVLVLVGLTDHVDKLIKISQLDKVLKILPTVQEGIDAVFMHEIENDLNQESQDGDNA